MDAPVSVVKSLMYRWRENQRHEAELIEREILAHMLRTAHARERASLHLEFKLLGMTLDDYDVWDGTNSRAVRFAFYQLHKDMVGGSASANGSTGAAAVEGPDLGDCTSEQPPVKKARHLAVPYEGRLVAY